MLILLWLRQRGFVFWFSVALVIVTIGTLIGMLAAIGESQGNISFRFLKAKPDLSLSMSASPQTATRNGSLIYTVLVTNEGPGEAKKIVVNTTLPPGVVFTSAQPADPACFESEGSGELPARCARNHRECEGDHLGCGRGIGPTDPRNNRRRRNQPRRLRLLQRLRHRLDTSEVKAHF